MKKRRLSILLSIVMLFSLLPTTALAANYPGASSVNIDGNKPFGSPSKLHFKNGDLIDKFTGDATDFNAAYDETTGTLTLKKYDGGQITIGGASAYDLTIKLIGDNTITVNGYDGITTAGNGSNITITADSGSSGKLTINVNSSATDAVGINNYYGAGSSGNVTIKGYADVTINATTNSKDRGSYGIYADNVVIEDHAKAAITANAPSNEGGGLVYGIFAKKNVTINTAGEVTVDASKAGTGNRVYSTGVNSQGRNLTLKKVGGMTVKWNSESGTQGEPFYPNASFDSNAYDYHVNKDDKANCIATYTPKVATANISLDKTDTMDFGSMEAGYATAPAEQSVTITNNGTANTGEMTIALDGANKNDFTLNKTTISGITASGTDTFTVRPNTGLTAGTYNATVKVSGSGAGVTEQSFNVKFTVTDPLTAIAVPAANTGLVYNGTKQTGVNADTGYTLGGTYEATDVGAADYTATATLDAGYKWNDGSTGVKMIKWNIGKGTLTADNFNFVAPTDPEYDGNGKTASITLKSPLTGAGTITPTYTKDGSAVTEAKDVGDYTVKFAVGAGDNFDAASDLTAAEWKFSITPANQNAPASLGVAAPTASGGKGKITGTTDKMEYSTDRDFTSPAGTTCSATETAVAPGTYYVRFKAKTNYNAGAVSAALVVPNYSATKYTVTVTPDTNGTAIADKISAAAGETVTLTATPNSGYIFDNWTDKTPDGLTINTDGTFTMPSENVRVKATFKGAPLTGTASITGTLKFKEELTATLTGDNNTGNLTYKWYRSGETTEIATNNTGKYTLVAEDIGKTITVKISSDVQTGEITGSTTGTINKADGPAAPAFTLGFTLNSDGKTFTATIPTVTGGEYSFDGAIYSATNTKTDCTANNSYTGYVRIKETPTHKTGTETSSTQTAPKLTVATPTFTPNGASSFSGTQRVTIKCDTEDAKIYYTINGETPTASSTEYTTALSLTSTTTVKAIAIKTGMNDSKIATATFTKASGGSGGSGGGGYVPKTQKPEIKAAAGGKTVLSKDGTTLTITADAGKVIDKVLLNGKDMGAASELKGLKTGDKVEVTFKDQVTEPTKEQLDKAAKEAAGELVLAARSAKLKNGSVKIMLKGDLKAITDAGYTVKYKFYRSTKKSAGYKAVLTKKAPTYVNTYGKQGTMYYYKAKVMIYDKEGDFVAQTALKQCKYANRLWTK